MIVFLKVCIKGKKFHLSNEYLFLCDINFRNRSSIKLSAVFSLKFLSLFFGLISNCCSCSIRTCCSCTAFTNGTTNSSAFSANRIGLFVGWFVKPLKLNPVLLAAFHFLRKTRGCPLIAGPCPNLLFPLFDIARAAVHF